MPKSRFDPQRHRKSQRHNPIATSGREKPVKSSSSSTAQEEQKPRADQPSVAQQKQQQFIPLLTKLPLPTDPPSAHEQVTTPDKIWALASVSLLLSPSAGNTLAESKHNRRLLLSHNIIARILYALQGDSNLDVKREASGALRNLCVDAGRDVRGEVANKGGVEAVLGTMKWAAQAFGFQVASLSGSSSAFQSETVDEREQRRALLSVPIEQMNKKQRRHAARIAAAMGKPLEEIAGKGLPEDGDDEMMDGKDRQEDAAKARGPGHLPLLDLEDESRKDLLELSENLVTVVWCLCESGGKTLAKLVSWKWTDEAIDAGVEVQGQKLASWLCDATALGCRAVGALSLAARQQPDEVGSASAGADPLASLPKEELNILLDLSLASGNALCALTDGGETEFVSGLVGIGSKLAGSMPPSHKSSKAKAATSKSMEVDSFSDKAGGAQRLASIDRAVSLLEDCVNTSPASVEGDKVKRHLLSQTTMLGVLACGTLRNIAAGLRAKSASSADKTQGKGDKKRKEKSRTSPSSSEDDILVPGRSGSPAIPLSLYEEQVVLPLLMRLLSSHSIEALAASLGGEGACETDENSDKAKIQARAGERAQTLMLALEILAEMVGSIGGDGREEEEWKEDLEAGSDDEEMKEGADDDVQIEQNLFGDDGMEEEEEEEEDGQERKKKRKQQEELEESEKEKEASSSTRTGTSSSLTLSELIRPTEGKSKFNASMAEVLLPFARPVEASFVSLSGASPEVASVLRSLHSRSLSVINNLLLRLATNAPPPLSQPIEDPADQKRVEAFRSWVSHTGGTSLIAAFKALFEIARGCASVPSVASGQAKTKDEGQDQASAISPSGPTSSEGDEGSDGLTMVETCIGSMWSLARILEGNVPLSWSSDQGEDVLPSNADSNTEVTQALMAAYYTSRTDSMRAKCLGTLSTIGRSSSCSTNLNGAIGNFLIQVMQNLPPGNVGAQPSGKSSPPSSTTTAEAMVAALNGIFDMYADENSAWDVEVFRKGGFLNKLRDLVFVVKAATRRIDRRKQLSLRASAEEAQDNLVAFVQYRQSLGF
ncbi:hypothetical protein IE53DRAFT_385013 [Violaceomyces palustris]|uniref:Uncharacterized protein n=1 Tax=Violaceomyces palustris TaxID=1673888 RepID=A0ACD0P360_9BASI|nr:hypothetical protein IE53DRAFT_385013 [Violaceomyces palustris]